jgi:predicted aspartyl protease
MMRVPRYDEETGDGMQQRFPRRLAMNEMVTDRRKSAGRFSVEFDVANHEDIIKAKVGVIPAEQIRRARLSGVVDTGAMRLMLPPSVVANLGLTETGQIAVRFADGRRDEKKMVGHVQVKILDRSGVFTAVVEPGRSDALIGAIVLEELDLIPDCTRQALVPRDPNGLFAEID